MISQETINEVIRRLVKAYNPLQIYLHGDYAWGTPNEESSFDLLVVVETSEESVIKRGYAAFEALLGLKIPQNTVVFTKKEFDKYAQDPKSDTYEIKTKGKILYARD